MTGKLLVQPELCGDSIRVVHPLFQAECGGSIPTSPLQLEIVPIGFVRARALNALWHSTLPRMGTGFVANQPFPCFAAICDGFAYAVAIWSNPVARNLPQHDWLELRRLAIAPDAPKNTASRMLAVMAHILKRERAVSRLISYQDLEAHKGTIYKAAGWVPTAINNNGTWNRPNRSRPEAQRPGAKLRWEKVL